MVLDGEDDKAPGVVLQQRLLLHTAAALLLAFGLHTHTPHTVKQRESHEVATHWQDNIVCVCYNSQ